MRSVDSFYGLDRPVRLRGCDCPGCAAPGDYRAPRDRSLSDYYFFCLDHVREYNRNWDYFSGMSGGEIEGYIRGAVVWERPTWPLGEWRLCEQKLRETVIHEFFADAIPASARAGAAPPPPALPKAARDALTELELQPPVDFLAIKAQYRLLVKRHHPDANGGSRNAEEKFKNINQAFAVLKEIFGEEVA
jgi:DnaJ domain